MTVLAYDDVMLREPLLLVPRMQPLGPVRVNRSHPLAKKLKYYLWFDGGGAVDLVSGARLTKNGSPKMVGTRYGAACEFDMSVRDSFTGVVNDWSGSNCLVEWFGWIDSLDGSGTIMVEVNSSLYWQIINSNNFAIAADAVQTATIAQGDKTFVHFAMGGVSDDATQRVWRNGIDITTSGQDAKRALSTGVKTVNFCKYSGGTSWDYDGVLAYIRLWNDLSTAELVSLALDPYQFLIPA